jgi:hypothetical protein
MSEEAKQLFLGCNQTLQHHVTNYSNALNQTNFGVTCLDACKDGIRLTEDDPEKRNLFYGMIVDAVNTFGSTPKAIVNDNP